MSKNNITIVSPTHYRHKYLERVLEYYKNSGFKILVADSTNERFKKANRYKIDYFHYPDSSFFLKMQDILKKVTTKYCVFCADDDFIVKESLNDCVKFLEKHSDYSCAQGRYVGFFKHEGKYTFKPLYFNNKDLEISENQSSQRILTLMSNYMQFFYAVHKTSTLKSFFADCIKNDMTNPILSEVGLGMYSLISGKYKTLETFFCARDNESPSSEVDRTTLDIIVETDEYQDVLAKFKKMVVEHSVLENSEITYQDLDNAINVYCENIKKIKLIREKNKINQLEQSTEILNLKIKRTQKKLLTLNGYPNHNSNIMSWENILLILNSYPKQTFQQRIINLIYKKGLK